MVDVGAEGRVTAEVGEGDLATDLGSGDVPVLGTPRVLALLEAAAVAAVAGSLDDASTTVGAQVSLEHLVPTWPGGRVEAFARLEHVDGRRLEFSLRMVDGDGREVARGRHRRVVVDRARFAR